MAETPAAHAMPTPGSGQTCPGCAKAIDPLRAGHVAIHDGQFLYYCDQRCKASHLLLIAQHLGDEVATLDPPAVAERLASAPISMARPTMSSGFPVTRSSIPTVSSGSAIAPSQSEEGNPETLRSPPISAPSRVPSAERKAPGEGAAQAVAIAGLVAGMLVPALSLAGGVATVARVPLVVVAALALVARVS